MKNRIDEDDFIQAREDLKALYDPSSLCYGDGYYIRMLETKYRMSVSEMKKELGTPKMKVIWEWHYELGQ